MKKVLENNYVSPIKIVLLFHRQIIHYTMRNILLLTALSMLLTIGCNNSNNAEQQEDNTVADSLEMARQDSIQKAETEAKLNEEREDEAEQFCKNFSLEKLMSMLTLQDGFEEKSGMSLIYKDVIIGEEVDEDEIVYGFGIEKTDKKTLGYNLKSTTRHSCFYQINYDTSTNPSLNFSDKDDANAFYDKASKCKTIVIDGTTYYIHEKQDDKYYPIHIQTPYGDDDFETHFALSRPEKNGDFYRISVEVFM